jgi:hypothetical protein
LDGGDNADGNSVQEQSAGASPNSNDNENEETQDTSNQSIDAVVDVDANEAEEVTRRIKILRKEYINSLMLPPRLRGRGRNAAISPSGILVSSNWPFVCPNLCARKQANCYMHDGTTPTD